MRLILFAFCFAVLAFCFGGFSIANDHPADVDRPNLSNDCGQVQVAGNKCKCTKRGCKCGKNCQCRRLTEPDNERPANETSGIDHVGSTARNDHGLHNRDQHADGKAVRSAVTLDAGAGRVSERLVERTALRGSAFVVLEKDSQRIHRDESAMRVQGLRGNRNRSASRFDVQGTSRPGMRPDQPYSALSGRGQPSFMGWA